MRIRQWPWAVALVCVVLGFMLSTQFKVQKQVAKNVTSMGRAQELASQLQAAEHERDRLMIEADDLRSQVLSLAKNQVEFQDLAQQLELAQLYAGLIPVSGRGVTITLNDSTRPITPGENPNALIIHDEDVLKTVNELAASGAEAISINGQRLTARSEIRCTGPTITINGVRTAPPIVITAVGDPDALESSLTMRGGVFENLKLYGIIASVKKENMVTVPAYKGSLKLTFGTPVAQEVPKP